MNSLQSGSGGGQSAPDPVFLFTLVSLPKEKPSTDTASQLIHIYLSSSEAPGPTNGNSRIREEGETRNWSLNVLPCYAMP